MKYPCGCLDFYIKSKTSTFIYPGGYLELKAAGSRRNHSGIYYHRFRYECDFLVMNKGRIESAVQVCRSLDEPETLKRELRGLLDAMQAHKLSEGFIITEDHEETIIENGSTVHVIPAWKYLLAEELELM